MKNIKYFKLNEDDILEIVSEYLAEKEKVKEFETKSIIMGKASEDLRIIVAVGASNVSSVNLKEVDKTMDFNGEHSDVDGLTNENMLSALDKMITTGDF